MISMKLEGLAGLQAQLEELKAATAARALRRAARIAFQPVFKAALSLVPVDTGLLRDGIKLVTQRGGDGDVVVKVGLKVAAVKGAKKLGRETLSPHWRWHFVELGTRFQAAQPFLRPALEANSQGVLDVLRDELAKGIARALRRQQKGKR